MYTSGTMEFLDEVALKPIGKWNDELFGIVGPVTIWKGHRMDGLDEILGVD